MRDCAAKLAIGFVQRLENELAMDLNIGSYSLGGQERNIASIMWLAVLCFI